MASSSNRFATLGEGSSDSKDQGAKVPAPGSGDTNDQTMQDSGQADPELSLGGLESSLPTVTTTKEKMALFRKRQAQYFEAEEKEEEEKRTKKLRQATGSKFVSRIVPSAAPDEMDTAEDFDFRNITNPDRRLKCMFQYQYESGETTNPIGNIWALEQKGWGVFVTMDAGRYGTPKVTLSVRINADKTALLSPTSRHTEHDATWRAGIQVDGLRVIETLKFVRVKEFLDNPAIYNKQVIDRCPKEQEHTLDKLAAVSLICTSANLSELDAASLEGLDDDVKYGLESLFYGIGTHTVTIWFLAQPNIDLAMNEWCRHLETAVSSGLPALSQYLTPDGQPNVDIDNIEPIQEFKNGMYTFYYPKRDEKNAILRKSNRKPLEDKSRPRGYYYFDRKLSWEIPYEWGVYNTIPIIREVQFSEAQVVYLSLKPQLVYLQNMGSIKVKGIKGGYTPKELTGVYKAFIRQTTAGAPPAPGARVSLQWDNSNTRIGKPHVPSTDYRDTWKGTVMTGTELACKVTGTDFCVMLNRPNGARIPRSHPPVDKKLPNEKLLLAHVEVVNDRTSAQREIDGMKKFADETYDAANLGPVRMAIMSDPSRLTHTTTDLTAKDPEAWRKWERYCRPQYVGNEGQLKVVTSVKEVKNKMTACIGPPGTGKTRVLTDVTIGAVLCGHKTLVCAVSNNAVDKAANSIWKRFPATYRDKYKFLRYETTSAEMQAYLTRTNVQDITDQDKNARPTYKEGQKLDDDDLIAQTMGEAAVSMHDHTETLKKLYKQTKSWDEALAQKRRMDERKPSNVASAMTLPNRIFDLTQEDQYNAAASYQSELAAYRREKMDPAELERVRESGGYTTETELEALGQDPLPEAEIEARMMDGRIQSPQQRDKSFDYRQSVKNYIEKDGQVTRQARLQFQSLRMQMVIRVMGATDVVLTTCNNAGSELVKLGFDPSFINIDEAGQLTVGALANVLTSFRAWEAVYLFGDPKQLLPYLTSGRANEFKAQAETSVLLLLEEKNYPILRLVIQYRMAPAISQFPAKYFYDGLLQDHDSVTKDTELRQIARAMSKELYGRKGPNGEGSEYWMINVVNGVSRVQLNGTSLQNYANASAIATLVDQALSRGVKADQITILVYYTGELSLVAHKIEATAQSSGRQWTLSTGTILSSVDSFQGEENEFVIIDIVAAQQGVQKTGAPANDEESEDEEEEEGPEGFKRSGKLTAHVKNPNRLCCALTRGRSCVVVVGQMTAILGTVKESQTKATATIGAMAKDLMERKLVFHDYTNLDTSPVGEEMRAKWDQARKNAEVESKRKESLNFLSNFAEKLYRVRITEDVQTKASRMYRTQSRRTTRPNMSGATVDAAENDDVVSGRTQGALITEAGAVPVTEAGPSQRNAKQEKKAKAAVTAAEKKAADEAANAPGKGNVKPLPPDPKGKGKAKEEAPPKAKGKGRAKEAPPGPKGKGKEKAADPKGKGKAKEVPEKEDFDIQM